MTEPAMSDDEAKVREKRIGQLKDNLRHWENKVEQAKNKLDHAELQVRYAMTVLIAAIQERDP